MSEKAEADIETALAWFHSQLATDAGIRWFAAIWKAIDKLERAPDRCPLAIESDCLGLEIRELLFGRRRGKYRILFEIRQDTVTILRVWHGARDAIHGEDL
jgi:plasmid stabilization system protein ParE